MNRADSKSVELLASSVGSNPTLSVLAGQLFEIFIWRDDREAEGARLESVCARKGTEGSNPSLSVPP